MKRSRKLSWTLVVLAIWLVMFAWGANSYGAEATLTWEEPFPVDSRIVGYNIYLGTELPLTDIAYAVHGSSITEQLLSELTEDEWYFVTATSRDVTGDESDQATPLHFKAEVSTPPVTDPEQVIEVETRLPCLQININMR